jgi:hypothetical protein
MGKPLTENLDTFCGTLFSAFWTDKNGEHCDQYGTWLTKEDALNALDRELGLVSNRDNIWDASIREMAWENGEGQGVRGWKVDPITMKFID